MAVGPYVSALVAVIKQAKPRKSPDPILAKVLKGRMDAEARAFFEAWAEYRPVEIDIGDLQIGGGVVDADVGRKDLLVFGWHGGGDLWAFDLPPRTVRRLAHDELWDETIECSLEPFLEHCVTDAHERGRTTDLDGALEQAEHASPAKAEPARGAGRAAPSKRGKARTSRKPAR